MRKVGQVKQRRCQRVVYSLINNYLVHTSNCTETTPGRSCGEEWRMDIRKSINILSSVELNGFV